MIDGIKNALGASLILIIIGMVIGSWILSGTIQTMVYYGLDLLSPAIFLPAAFLLAAITSILIGSSFGTIATMGIVLLGVAEGLGVPKAITVEAIVSGAMLGDKISPMSDSTNLTAAMSSTELFNHIKSMLSISLPAALISLFLYTVIGRFYLESGADLANINLILSNLEQNFNITLWTLSSAYIMLLATGEMFISIVIPGRTLAPAYQEMNIKTSVLSHSLETASTLGCSILP